jgi:hypothetical protein
MPYRFPQHHGARIRWIICQLRRASLQFMRAWCFVIIILELDERDIQDGPLMSGRALQCRTDGSFLGSRLIKRIKLDRALEQDKQAGVRKAKGMRTAFLPLARQQGPSPSGVEVSGSLYDPSSGAALAACGGGGAPRMPLPPPCPPPAPVPPLSPTPPTTP